MSKWQEIKKEDVDIEEDEVQVLVGSDDEGNNYITFPLKFIFDLLLINKK